MLALCAAIIAGAATNLGPGPKEARDAIATIPGLEFNPKQVRIKSIDPIRGGAVVEAQIETAFRLDNDGKWKVAEMRLGDGRWENIELIVTAVRNEKIKRTRDELQAFSAAIAAYHRE